MYHTGLLLTFFAAFGYTLATFYFKAASVRGASGIQLALWANLALALIAQPFWILAEVTPLAIPLWKPVLAGLCLCLGQVCSFCAITKGNVSLVTPLLGTKIVIVTAINALFFSVPIAFAWWMAACLATLGVALVTGCGVKEKTPSEPSGKYSFLIAPVYALAAATLYSCHDVIIQNYTVGVDLYAFLPMMFGVVGLLTFGYCLCFSRDSFRLPATYRHTLVVGACLLALESTCFFFGLALSKAATAVNVVYSLRSLLTVVAAWLIGRHFVLAEHKLPRHIFWIRIGGAALIFSAILLLG